MSAWFYDKSHNFVECNIIQASPKRRKIKLHNEEATVLDVHPEGVVRGKYFPRVFVTGSVKRPRAFQIHDRIMLIKDKEEHSQNAIPSAHEDYRFQPFIADVIDSIYQNQNVILTGGTGVGKTTHITQLANRIHQPLLRINFNGETRMSDLIGKVHVIGGETRWVDGILPMAMRRGWWLLLDELDFAEPAVLSLLHPVLEEESMLVLKENNGEIIRPHDGFRIFATANSIGAMSDRSSSYAGTNEMNEAFLDRWQVILVENLSVEEETKVLRKAAPALRNSWAKHIAQFAAKARQGEFEYAGDNFSTRKSIAWAKKTELHQSPLKGAQLAWLDKIPVTEQEGLKKVIQVQFGSGKRSKLKTSKKTTIKKAAKK